jgi:hypothetical protein
MGVDHHDGPIQAGHVSSSRSRLTVVRHTSVTEDWSMSEVRRRILLAVRPRLLEGALIEVLSASGTQDVVRFTGGAEDQCAVEYDAAFVCTVLPDTIRSRVVITLPDCYGSGGRGVLQDHDGVREVRIDGPEQIIELLHEYAPPALEGEPASSRPPRTTTPRAPAAIGRRALRTLAPLTPSRTRPRSAVATTTWSAGSVGPAHPSRDPSPRLQRHRLPPSFTAR